MMTLVLFILIFLITFCFIYLFANGLMLKNYSLYDDYEYLTSNAKNSKNGSYITIGKLEKLLGGIELYSMGNLRTITNKNDVGTHVWLNKFTCEIGENSFTFRTFDEFKEYVAWLERSADKLENNLEDFNE